MASKTDLAGYLRNDPGCVSQALEEWFVTGDSGGKPPKIPARIRVLYRSPGATSEEVLHELTISEIPRNGASIVEAIEQTIIKKLGPTPLGRFRIRGAGHGSQASPGLDVARTLAESEDQTDIAFLKARNAQQERELRETRDQLTQLALGAQTLASQMAERLMQISTHRAAAASAADLGGISGIFGLVALLIFKPHIEASLKGEDGPLKRIGDRLLGLMLPPDPLGSIAPKGRQPTAAEMATVIKDPVQREQIAKALEATMPNVRALLEAAAASVEAGPVAPEAEVSALPIGELLPSQRAMPPAAAVRPGVAPAEKQAA